MAKIVIVFVLALIAIEGIQSALMNKHPIDVVKSLRGGNFKIGDKPMRQFLNLLRPLGSRSSQVLLPDYELRLLVVQTKTKIAQHIFDHDVLLAKECGQAVDREARTMEDNATNGVYKGLDMMYAAFKPFEADYVALMARQVAMEKRYVEIYFICLEQFPNDQAGYRKCVTDHAEAEGLQAEFEEINKLGLELQAAMDPPMQAAFVIFMKDMNKLGADITQQADTVLANLSKCYSV